MRVLVFLGLLSGLLLIACSDDPGPASTAPKERAAAPKADVPLAQAVGATLIMSYDGTEPPPYILRRLRKGEGAGVILFAKNAPDAASLKRATDAMQRAAGGDALVMTDQEGAAIRNVPFADGPAELRALGVNVNLAPVADVPQPGTALVGRGFPGTPAEVGDRVAAYVRAHTRERVATTAKHFPGLGRAAVNTDDGSTAIGNFEQAELEPFRAAIEAEVPLMMSSHALYPSLDPKDIASQSKPILTGLLREQLGFRGAVVTDSIEAQAVLDRSDIATAAERSIEAGTDLILMTGSGSFNEIQPRLLSRARQDAGFERRIREAASRARGVPR